MLSKVKYFHNAVQESGRNSPNCLQQSYTPIIATVTESYYKKKAFNPNQSCVLVNSVYLSSHQRLSAVIRSASLYFSALLSSFLPSFLAAYTPYGPISRWQIHCVGTASGKAPWYKYKRKILEAK